MVSAKLEMGVTFFIQKGVGIFRNSSFLYNFTY